MKNHTFRVAGILIVFWFCLSLANASQPCLKQFVRTNGQATVLLEGETRVGYVLQASSNLVNWQPCLTNAGGYSSKRLLTLDAPGSFSYYRAQRIPAPVFSFAIAAKEDIDLNGNNLVVDSFDSSNPLCSRNGEYDITKRNDHGDIAAGGGFTNSLSVGHAAILGHVLTSSNGTVALGGSSSVGTLSWYQGRCYGIMPGFYTNDLKMDFPDVEMPHTGGYLVPAGGTNAGVYYNYIFYGGGDDYALDSLTDGNYYVTGNVVLHILGGDINLSYQSMITIASNSSLTIYMGGTNTYLGGNGVLNQSGNATNFCYFGLPANTNISISGAPLFIGTLYAPSATLTMYPIADFVGACVVKKLLLKGRVNFHYDEALQGTGFVR